MQPTKHMKGSEDELIAHIKESLSGYEEEYVPGSWENFNGNNERKNTPLVWLWRLGSAAAVILIAGASILFFSDKATNQLPVQRVQNKQGQKTEPPVKIAEENIKENNPSTEVKINERIAVLKQNNNVSILSGQETISDSEPVEVTGNIVKESAGIIVKEPATVAPNTSVSEPKSEIAKVQVSPNSTDRKTTVFQEFLNNETKNNQANPVAKNLSQNNEDRWEMGVVVAPSFGNTKKLNMGYGVSMGYALTNKISLNSGISYNEMAASKSLPAPVMTTAIAKEAKSLESIEAKVTGIDIPLEIKYQFSKSLYANVGVSAFAVINQKQSNSYIQEKLVERAINSESGLEELKTFAVNERITETAPEPEIKDGKYIGFYNFSFGYKQKISKNKAVSVEPFMKVPMKEVSKENLRLIGTGVRLKLDF